MILNITVVTAALVGLILYISVKIFQKWSWTFKISGTPLLQWDISGDLMKIVKLKQNFGQKMVETYGRLYRIVLNRNPILVIADPAYCQQLYQGGVHTHPAGLGLGKYFERHLGDCMGCLNGKESSR